MTDEPKPPPKTPYQVPSVVLLSMQAGMASVYAAALLTGARGWAWTAAGIMALFWLVQWSNWVVARRNLGAMPLFGCGASSRDTAREWPRVAVIAAARNEADAIEPAVRSMVAQDYPALEVVIVDDHSRDATPAILDRLAAESPRLRVIHDPPPQPGWIGKQNALREAVERLGPGPARLLFTDADIVFGPTVLRDAVEFAEAERVDFLTCLPYLETGSWIEEIVLMSGWLRHLEWVQYARLNDPNAFSVGIGAFMLVRRETYAAAGGHAAIRDEACDDAALARAMKRSGARMGLGWAADQLRCRQYAGFRDMTPNLVRKLRLVLKDRPGYLLATTGWILLQWVAPLPLAVAAIGVQAFAYGFRWPLSAWAAAALAVYLQSALWLAVGRQLCPMRRVTPCLMPVAGIVRAWIAARAFAESVARRPLRWRDRLCSPFEGG